MALPRTTPSSWIQGIDFPSKLFETSGNDYELYEEDGEFVLTVELPGYDPEEISLSWEDGVLNVAAQHEDESRGKRRTFHQRFRFPKSVNDTEITAEYTNGMLEVTLPVKDEVISGKEIEIDY